MAVCTFWGGFVGDVRPVTVDVGGGEAAADKPCGRYILG